MHWEEEMHGHSNPSQYKGADRDTVGLLVEKDPVSAKPLSQMVESVDFLQTFVNGRNQWCLDKSRGKRVLHECSSAFGIL